MAVCDFSLHCQEIQYDVRLFDNLNKRVYNKYCIKSNINTHFNMKIWTKNMLDKFTVKNPLGQLESNCFNFNN